VVVSFIFMFWYSYRGLEPRLQRAHAGRTQNPPKPCDSANLLARTKPPPWVQNSSKFFLGSSSVAAYISGREGKFQNQGLPGCLCPETTARDCFR
jgi:hypothetical protein